MFTGIIQELGQIAEVTHHNGDLSLAITAPEIQQSNPALGDSIAVNGVCLTLVDKAGSLVFDVSAESISRTLMGDYTPGLKVNLESALKVGDALGGHLVSGHVDGIAKVVAIESSARSTVFDFQADASYAPYIAEKGSICLDGISLTVNAVEDQDATVIFSVNIVPHTLNHTNLGNRNIGDQVHLEIDQVARYLQRILSLQSN